jgi:rhamnogalacturonan endolyase
MKMEKFCFTIIVMLCVNILPSSAHQQMEDLGRGLNAVMKEDDVYMGWRLLASDPDSIAFNVYRGEILINETPVSNSTNFLDTLGTVNDLYRVVPVLNGIELTEEFSEAVSPWPVNYLTVPLQRPAGGNTPDGGFYTYSPNDCSTGDLDGDRDYEIVLKWDPSNSKDNSQSGYTGNVFLDGIQMDGTLMWRIDLGVNIRAGAHYTQFMVYDLDGDGKAEIACKTAPGTRDATGNYLQTGPANGADHTRDYRNSGGYVLSGPEYFTLFDGETGTELVTTDYIPQRGSLSSWGDTYGNRVDRFLACIAYLDGVKPSVVMCRGYYTGSGRGRTVLAAWDYRNGVLTNRWTFNADLTGENPSYTGQGNHNLSVADVDDDGKDEIIYGSIAIDDDGNGLWNSRLGHGDAMHVSDIDPDRPGLEVWSIHENAAVGAALLDARTGAIIWGTGPADVGRGTAGNLVPEYRGMECWGGTNGLRTCRDSYAGPSPYSTNHVVWWDGDLCRELLDSNNIRKYNGGYLLVANGCSSNNGTKSNPALQADLFGDWREEVIWRTSDNQSLRIYTTTDLTDYRLVTLMQDHVYRMGIAWQNVAYNQPPHTGYYVGAGMFIPDSLRPPVPPLHFSVSAMTDTVILSWDANYEPDLAGYSVYRAKQEDGSFTRLNDNLIILTEFTDTDVQNDTIYYYTVTAVDTDNNESDYAEILKAIPTIRPDWPLDLEGRSNLNSVKIFWNMPDETNILGYNVYRSTRSSENYRKINDDIITEMEYVDEPLPRNLTFYYAVTAVNYGLLESFFSEEISVKTGPTITLQAEEGMHGGVVYLDSNHPGFNGSGFVNFEVNASSVTFNNIPGFTGGQYNLIFRYALGNTDRTGLLIVNGNSQSLTMKGTGDWENWTLDSVLITLETGFGNTIRFESNGSDFGNLDEITIGPAQSTGIDQKPFTNAVPRAFALHDNYPNPFNPETTIPFDLPVAGHVRVRIYDVSGRLVDTLTDQHYEAGFFEIRFRSGSLASGVYFIQCRMNGKVFMKKVMLLK